MSPHAVSTNTPWRETPGHRRWLESRGGRDCSRFFEPESIDPAGGFFSLDIAGRALPDETARPLHATTRMAHCFAIGQSARAGPAPPISSITA